MKKLIFGMMMLASAATATAQDGKLKVVKDTTQSMTKVAQALDNVEVVTRVEKTKMNGDVLVTRLVGTPLANAGSAADALARVPGLMRRNGSIEVIGKGSPIYYINGRKVNDISELQRLSSQEIKEVEVINTPGAQYDAQVNAVVRIKTVKRRGKGLGGSLDANDYYGLRFGDNRLNGSLNLNYRQKSVELFGGLTLNDHRLEHYKTDFNQSTFSKANIEQIGKTDLGQHYKGLQYSLGADWQIADNHSAGFRVERNDNLHGRTSYQMDADIYSRTRTLIEQLSSHTLTMEDGVDSWSTNAYYQGQIGKMEMNLNIDYYHTDDENHAITTEKAMTGNRTVDSKGTSSNDLYAGKVVFSYPLGKGKLQAGAEVDIVKRDNEYNIDQKQIADDRSKVNENTYAVFVEYGTMTPYGMLNLGLRYEHVDFEFKNLFDASQNINRGQDHLYPTVSFGTQIKEVQASLSYSVKTRRPNYRLLRSNIEYNNRYTLSTGNPKLKNEINNQAAINMRWRFLSMSVNYQNQQNGIYDWTHPYGEDGTVMFDWVNFDKPIHSLGTFVNVTNTWGHWTPSYTVGLQKQWLSFDLDDPRETSGKRTVKYNKPMYIVNAYNAWRLPSRRDDGFGAWQFELNSEFLSDFHWGNAEVANCYWNLSCAIQKSWLENDALSVRLAVNDIFGKAHHNVRIDLGNYVMSQTHINGVERSIYDPQTVSLTVRYKFNATKNKYRGTGAGNEIKARM